MDAYLLGLRLAGRRVVVVGGGAVATRRIPALLDVSADIVLVSPSVTASLEDLAAAGRIRWEPRRYADGDCAGAWLVCACTDDAAANEAVAAEAERQRTWYVRADDARASAACTPATGRAEDVTADDIGVGDVRAEDVRAEDVGAGGIQSALVQRGAIQRGSVQVGVLSGDPRHSAA